MLPTYSLQRLADRWTIEKKLGSGTYARVYLAHPAKPDAALRPQVAIKRYRESSMGREGLSDALVRELSLLRRHQHGNLLALHEVCYCRGVVSAVLEYMPLTLEDLLDEKEVARPWAEVAPMLQQLLRALAFLHSWRVVHRDIAVGNVFLSDANLATAVVKLGDLNLSRIQAPHMTPGMVTLNYRAPELFGKIECYGPEIDLWACGCVAAEVLRGSVLFDGDGELEVLAEILGSLGVPSAPLCKRLGLNLRNVRRQVDRVKSRLAGRKLVDRLYTDDIQAKKLIEGMLDLNPDQRLSAQQCLDCLHHSA